MSRITTLLRRLERENPGLATDLREEVDRMAQRRAFGLNFERHVPESVELPHRGIRRGDKVRFLPPRGEPDSTVDKRLWIVNYITREGDQRIAHLVEWQPAGEPEETTRSVEDLVVVAEFRDPIYPGLRSTGTVDRGGDKPYHIVINGENYHALDTLLFAYEGKVDCIYIDPPYNTRDKDWKYNNDYVDSDDIYKHSKWLAMMERRLRLAKKLLNPQRSVLIVTIDEKEYLRLGLLLEQTFRDANIQMVSSVVNRSGSTRWSEFSRVDEYIFFVMFGDAYPADIAYDTLDPDATAETEAVTWHGLRRRGSTNWRRQDRPGLFYPVFIRLDDLTVHSVGEPLPLDQPRDTVEAPAGTFAAWPLNPQGEEGTWQISPSRFREQLADGTLYLSSADPERGTAVFMYLKSGVLRRIAEGELTVVGRDERGRVIIQGEAAKRPKTIWNLASHEARTFGTALLSKFIGERKFPFPKSLYAVEDTLRFFVGNNPDAIVLDYFAGSGTTAHAVMRLNRQDGGRRQCILVTNNEVSAAEEKALRKKGLRPGDSEWERLGICEYITKPRLIAAATGITPEGAPVEGEYRFTDVFPMSEGFEENIEFFNLTYEDPEEVRLDMAFSAIAPLLWMRAGSQGPRIEKRSDTFEVVDRYGILFDVDAAAGFVNEVRKHAELKVAYIVTDEKRQYQLIARQLPAHVETVQLYEAYLTTFEINSARDMR